MDNYPKSSAKFYPAIEINLPQKPKRLYAFPLLGLFLKSITVIPVGIVLIFLSIVNIFTLIINVFVIFFTGKYWKFCYDLNLGIMRLATKSNFFVYGLTDKYPGFSTTIRDTFTVDIPMPEHPKRLYSTPIAGPLIRIVVLIPYAIYSSIIYEAAQIGMFVATFIVFFKGYYPESFYEIVRDSMRTNLAAGSYFVGFSDAYPSFWISMNHKVAKIILIIMGAIILIWNNIHSQPARRTYNYPTPRTVNPILR